jgi:hypothetical protein
VALPTFTVALYKLLVKQTRYVGKGREVVSHLVQARKLGANLTKLPTSHEYKFNKNLSGFEGYFKIL